MHELAITHSIVDLCAEAARGRRVLKVTLEIGKLSGVVADSVRFCFDVVAQGTLLDGAALEIVEPEGRARCRSCGVESPADGHFGICSCGARDPVLFQGEELKVKSMEVEDR